MIFSRVVVGVFVAALGVVGQPAEVQPFALASPGKLEQCKSGTIVWQGGKAPFKISIKPTCSAGQNASEEQHFVSTPATSFELPIKFPAGTMVVVSITDSSNMQATAPPATITSGDADDSCIVQTPCSDNIQAPNVPIALVPSSSGTAIPTDRLVTADPSAASAYTQASTTTAPPTSMVVLYTYIGASNSDPNPSTPTSSSKSNAASLGMSTSAAPIFCVVALVGHLVLGL
ncbi:hypothetical protein FRC08_018387 [Ceratobasidium sp. 394]|nr:hypothetical protein FRC08_018387 [Ceratobasidium sp. 394]KAG9093397.1 hypothetical protein FS749_014446 [Ceratobasidium sp. UAMH 11750]